ncbi:MAG: sigma-54-dependent Fis family transcriptional regulator [Endomicrobiales bacterium]|nr:sigma-54-dependent Fis family transcriptional regulator [Endomicrobiales bacterium]
MAKILIVDDEPGMRQVISKVLMPHGYKVILAEDGKQGLDLFQEQNPDLVLLDIRLPDMDGLEILANIRKMKSDIPVIMLSGFGDVETAVELVRQGAYDYISKPFKVNRLTDLVKQALAQSNITTSEQVVPSAPAIESKPAPAQPKKEVVREIEIKRSWIFIGAGAIVLLLAGLLSYFFLIKELPEAEFSIPYSSPSAICWDGQYLWVSDWMEETVFKHSIDDKLSIYSSYQLSDMQLTGIAYDGKNLWTCDSFQREIYKHKLDHNLSIVSTYEAPGPSISGLFFDGVNLWSMDFQEKKIYRHRIDDELRVLNTYESPAINPCGMFRKGKYFYIADASSNRIYKVKAENFSFEDVYIFDKYRGKKYPLAGITCDGKSIWSCADGMQKIIRHPFSDLKKIK